MTVKRYRCDRGHEFNADVPYSMASHRMVCPICRSKVHHSAVLPDPSDPVTPITGAMFEQVTDTLPVFEASSSPSYSSGGGGDFGGGGSSGEY